MKVRRRWIIRKTRGITSGSHSIRTLHNVIHSQSKIHYSRDHGVQCWRPRVWKTRRLFLKLEACLTWFTAPPRCTPVWFWSSVRTLIQGVGMKSTNKAGALSTLRMAPSYALPTREYAKLGDMMTYNSAANIQGLTEQFLFEEDRFEDTVFKPCRSWAQTFTKKVWGQVLFQLLCSQGRWDERRKRFLIVHQSFERIL